MNISEAEIEDLIARIIEVTKSPQSREFYRRVILQAGTGAVEGEFAELKDFMRRTQINDPARYFTVLLKNLVGDGEKGMVKKEDSRPKPKYSSFDQMPVWAEQNTVQYPFWILQKGHKLKEYEIKYQYEGKDFLWRIVALGDRLPGPAAIKILRALEKLYGQGMNEDGMVKFSINQLRSMCGLDYKSVVTELRCLTETAFVCRGTLFDVKTDRPMDFIKPEIGILKAIMFAGKKGEDINLKDKNNPFKVEKAQLQFNDWYVKNYLSKYVKRLPGWVLKATPQAERMWEIISITPIEKLKEKGMDYNWFCDRMPLKKWQYESKIKGQLNPMFNELKRFGVLKEWNIERVNGFFKLFVEIERREIEFRPNV